MSATLQLDETGDAATAQDIPRRHRAATRSTTRLPQTLLGIFCAALALRLYNIANAYNIFIDEVLYAQVGHNVAAGDGVELFGKPFNLHPPAPFGILGGVIRAFGLTDGSPTADRLLLDLRPVLAVFGALTVVAVFLVMRLCGAGRRVTAAVTALVALDPFQISFDSRVLLEAVTQFFVITTVALLLVLMQQAPAGRAGRWSLIGGAGVSAGLAVGSKETFGLVLTAVLVLLLVLPRLMPRRPTAAVAGIGALTYLLVVSTAWFSSGFGPWWHSKTSGFERLIGTEQTTGFNAATTNVTLTSRIFANVGDFGATYVILLAGGVVTILDLLRRKPWRGEYASPFERARTVVSIWNLCACGYLVYATLLGSIEEQMYYIPLVPCILSLGLAAASVRRVRVGRAIAVLSVLTLLFQAHVWLDVHRSHNNLYENFLTWQRSHVLPGARIGVTDQPASFLVKDATIGIWPTVTDLRVNRADYVLVDTALVDQGYSKMPKSTLTYLVRHAPVAYSTRTGDETLYFFDLRGAY